MPYKENKALKQMETTTGNHNQSKCRVVEPSTNRYVSKAQHTNAHKTEEERDTGYKSKRVCFEMCFLVILGVTPIKSDHNDCPM